MSWFIDRGRFLGVGILLFAACGRQEAEYSGTERGIVARIDSAAISAAELREFAAGIPKGLRPQGRMAQVRAEYLRSLLAKYLLLREAEVRHLDTLESVRRSVTRRWFQHLVHLYSSDFLAPGVQVSEEEVERELRERGPARRRKLAGILVAEEEAAQEVVRQLDAGRPFAEVAKERSLDRRSAGRGGVLGYISLEQARRLQIPEEIFHRLPQGRHSGILPLGKQYQILCFLGDTLIPPETFKAQARLALYRRRLEERERGQVDSLARALDWRVEPEGLRLLLGRASKAIRLLRQELTPAEAACPLFVYQGGQVTLGEYVDALWEQPMRALAGWGVRDSLEVLKVAGETVLPQTMLLTAARQAGVDRRPEVQRWLQQVREEEMIKELRRQEVVARVEVSREEAQDFYTEHAELFTQPDAFYLVEVLVKTEAEAREILRELKRGETLSSLAQQRSIRPSMREEAGLLYLHGTDCLVNPQLYRAAQQARDDEVVGPVRVEGGYSVFQVLHREVGELTPFAEAERRASAFVRRQKKDQLFEEWVDRLMEKYRDRIVIDEEELARALPDSLLQRLAQSSRRGGEQDED